VKDPGRICSALGKKFEPYFGYRKAKGKDDKQEEKI